VPEVKALLTRRLYIIGVFGLFGPAVATLVAMWEWTVASLFLLFPLFAMFGYVLGLVPAILAGFIYSILPWHWPRIVLSPFIGAGAAGIFLGGWHLLRGAVPLSDEGLLSWAAAGAVAALVCAILCWRLGVDAATRQVQ
jgi:hypothetical protein